MEDAKLLRCAREFVIVVDGERIFVTRYDNHRNLLPGDTWCVMHVRGALNPWYLSHDGLWRYKSGDRYLTFRDAIEMLEQSGVRRYA